jgi:hypothetical protein
VCIDCLGYFLASEVLFSPAITFDSTVPTV